VNYIEILKVLLGSLTARIRTRGDKAHWSLYARRYALLVRIQEPVWARAPIRAFDPGLRKRRRRTRTNRNSTLRAGNRRSLIGNRNGQSGGGAEREFQRQAYNCREALAEKEFREEVVDLALNRRINALHHYEYQGFVQRLGRGMSETQALECVWWVNEDEGRRAGLNDFDYYLSFDGESELGLEPEDGPEIFDSGFDDFEPDPDENIIDLLDDQLWECERSIGRSKQRLARIRELISA